MPLLLTFDICCCYVDILTSAQFNVSHYMTFDKGNTIWTGEHCTLVRCNMDENFFNTFFHFTSQDLQVQGITCSIFIVLARFYMIFVYAFQAINIKRKISTLGAGKTKLVGLSSVHF